MALTTNVLLLCLFQSCLWLNGVFGADPDPAKSTQSLEGASNSTRSSSTLPQSTQSPVSLQTVTSKPDNGQDTTENKTTKSPEISSTDINLSGNQTPTRPQTQSNGQRSSTIPSNTQTIAETSVPPGATQRSQARTVGNAGSETTISYTSPDLGTGSGEVAYAEPTLDVNNTQVYGLRDLVDDLQARNITDEQFVKTYLRALNLTEQVEANRDELSNETSTVFDEITKDLENITNRECHGYGGIEKNIMQCIHYLESAIDQYNNGSLRFCGSRFLYEKCFATATESCTARMSDVLIRKKFGQLGGDYLRLREEWPDICSKKCSDFRGDLVACIEQISRIKQLDLALYRNRDLWDEYCKKAKQRCVFKATGSCLAVEAFINSTHPNRSRDFVQLCTGTAAAKGANVTRVLVHRNITRHTYYINHTWTIYGSSGESEDLAETAFPSLVPTTRPDYSVPTPGNATTPADLPVPTTEHITTTYVDTTVPPTDTPTDMPTDTPTDTPTNTPPDVQTPTITGTGKQPVVLKRPKDWIPCDPEEETVAKVGGARGAGASLSGSHILWIVGLCAVLVHAALKELC